MDELIFDGEKILFESGDSVAAALLRSGKNIFRTTRFSGEPRSIFCGIGHCYDCLVSINGIINQRACLAKAEPGLSVEFQDGLKDGSNG
jgi:predicted molibdopterin-dependent oxidoreductase YjgC